MQRLQKAAPISGSGWWDLGLVLAHMNFGAEAKRYFRNLRLTRGWIKGLDSICFKSEPELG